jgi:hypothetical protein
VHTAIFRHRHLDHAYGLKSFLMPDLLFDERVLLSAGRLTFEVFHCPGETDDACRVWYPERRVVCSGDLVINDLSIIAAAVLLCPVLAFLMAIAIEILNHFGDAQPGAVGRIGRHGYLVETQSMRFFRCEPI